MIIELTLDSMIHLLEEIHKKREMCQALDNLCHKRCSECYFKENKYPEEVQKEINQLKVYRMISE